MGDTSHHPFGGGQAPQPRCPLEKATRLEVLDPPTMLVACHIEESDPCKMAFSYGGGSICRLLWAHAGALPPVPPCTENLHMA